jgi:hypothetical protein
MKALVYKGDGQIALEDKPVPEIVDATDAIIKGMSMLQDPRNILIDCQSSIQQSAAQTPTFYMATCQLVSPEQLSGTKELVSCMIWVLLLAGSRKAMPC